jgi:hypothetical protein
MSAYSPAPGVFVGRPPCAECGANVQLHRPPAEYLPATLVGHHITSRGLGKLLAAGVPLNCPQAYRPGTLEEAQRGLEEAERSGDPARVFVARGELQRLEGRP